MLLARAPMLFVVMLVLLAGAANGQKAALYEQDGVEYYMAVGEFGTGTMTMGFDPAANSTLPFTGCAVAKMRPDTNNGRIRVLGAVDGVPVSFDVNRFDPERPITTAVEVDAGEGILSPATIAAGGEASMLVGGIPYSDPSTNLDHVAATFFVTDRGFRDDATGHILDPAGMEYSPGGPVLATKGDWEMHVRFESLGEGGALSVEDRHVRPEPVLFMPTYLPPDDDHVDVMWFENRQFGGGGLLEIEASSAATEGNDVTFTLRRPGGPVITQMNATPSFGDAFSESFEFPLDRFGRYSVEVRGEVNLLEYTITVTKDPPERFGLDLWWEALAPGHDAVAAQEACGEALYGGQGPSGAVLFLPPPPAFPWHPVILTVLGGVITVLAGVKFTMMARAAAEHRRMSKD